MTTMEGQLFFQSLVAGTPFWPDYVMIPWKNGSVGNMGEIKRLPDFRFDARALQFLREAFENGLPSAYFDGAPAKPLSMVIRLVLERWDQVLMALFGPELSKRLDVDYLLQTLVIIALLPHILIYVDCSELAYVVPPMTTVFRATDFPVAFASAVRRMATNKILVWTSGMKQVREEAREVLKVQYGEALRHCNEELAMNNRVLQSELETEKKKVNDLVDAYHRDQERRETWGSAISSNTSQQSLGDIDSVEVQHWGRRLNDLDTFLTPNDLNVLVDILNSS